MFASSLPLPSLDEVVRSSFTGLRDSYFHWLLVCTVGVLVGVVLEECDSLFNRAAWKLDSAKGIFVPRYGLIRWKNRLVKLGWLLIVVGVLGEGIFEYTSSAADGLLQQYDDILLTDARKHANDAEISAKGAAEAAQRAKDTVDQVGVIAGKAKSLAEGAETRAAAAGTQVQSVKQQTDKLQQQANTLEAVIAAEDKRAIEIIKSMDQRFLAYTVHGENGPDVLDPLRAFPEMKVVFEVLPDVEARRAKWELEKLVANAHWKEVGMSLNSELFWAHNDGVQVEWGTAPNTLSPRPGDNSPEAAEALALFLMQHEWIARASPDIITPASKHEQLPINTIRIVIGFKPNLFFEPWLEESGQESLRSRERMEELLKNLPKN